MDAEVKLSNREYIVLNAQATNYRTVLRFLKASGINEFLLAHKRVPIDIMVTPDDTTGGESIAFFLKALATECNTMDQKITSLSEALVDTSIQLAHEKRLQTRKSFIHRVKDFVYTKVYVNGTELYTRITQYW